MMPKIPKKRVRKRRCFRLARSSIIGWTGAMLRRMNAAATMRPTCSMRVTISSPMDVIMTVRVGWGMASDSQSFLELSDPALADHHFGVFGIRHGQQVFAVEPGAELIDVTHVDQKGAMGAEKMVPPQFLLETVDGGLPEYRQGALSEGCGHLAVLQREKGDFLRGQELDPSLVFQRDTDGIVFFVQPGHQAFELPADAVVLLVSGQE